MIYLTLFIEFFKIGLFSIGGGMATIPFLMELTTKYTWFTTTELANMIAISESTPGPIGINMATYAGFHAGSIPGALIATFGLVCPALIIIILIAKFMSNFSDNKYVKSAFYGIRPMIAALIGYAVWQIVVITFADTNQGVITLKYSAILLGVIIFILLQIKPLKNIHPLIWIIVGAVAGGVFRV
ncbi:chromate transporter [Clostridium sp. D5]|uniref:chromate transporter n=1 Tax=Clostridium sp. D5 TaxID=556261 RepID=UPI0001FC822A|nr:chromate transporter [Clostridium sp. D5]EGB93750.1 chromate transport protein [Clostridium sp. D5]